MRAGRLDRRITVLRNVPTQSTSGAKRDNWVAVAMVWGSIKYDRGAERFAAQQLVGHMPVTFAIRWSSDVSDISALNRLAMRNRQYDITDIRELGRTEGIEIDAKARSEEAFDGSDSDLSVEALEDGGLELLE